MYLCIYEIIVLPLKGINKNEELIFSEPFLSSCEGFPCDLALKFRLWNIVLSGSIQVIYWVVPIPSNSHHQDFCIFIRKSGTKPSFVTAGKEDNPSCPCICRENLCSVDVKPVPALAIDLIWTCTKNPTISLRSKVLEAHQKPLDTSTSDLRTMQHGWLIIPGIYLA